MSTQTLPQAPAAEPRSGRPSSRLTATAPRVDLLPPEIGQRIKQAASRSGMRLLMFFALVLVLVGVAGAWYLSTLSQLALAEESEKTSGLVSQQAQYSDVREAQRAIAVGEAARLVGISTEIDWSDYLEKLAVSLPEGVSISEVVIDSETASAPYQQSEVPLEGARIATLTFTAKSATLPMIPDWLIRLRQLPGFVDALPGSVNLGADGYTAGITMHINEDAFSLRFQDDATTGDSE